MVDSVFSWAISIISSSLDASNSSIASSTVSSLCPSLLDALVKYYEWVILVSFAFNEYSLKFPIGERCRITLGRC